jgi:hypothetical protein
MRNNNPMPLKLYINMRKYLPDDSATVSYDLHHALVDKGDVMGMPLEERKKIHDPRNLWWVRSDMHASHANIVGKRAFYLALCARFGKEEVDEFINSFKWKSATPPVTVGMLE